MFQSYLLFCLDTPRSLRYTLSIPDPGAISSNQSLLPPAADRTAAAVRVYGCRPYTMNLLNHDLLTAEQESALIATYQNGAPEAEKLAARDELLMHNMKLIHKLCKRYCSDWQVPEELYSDAIEGFFIALDRFDPSRAGRLSTYAVYHIRNRLNLSDQHQTTIHTASHIPPHEQPLSLDYIDPHTNEKYDWIDKEVHIGDETHIVDDCQWVERLLEVLTDVECDLIARYYGLSPYPDAQTLREIGDFLGISHQRAQMRYEAIMRKLKAASRALECEDPIECEARLKMVRNSQGYRVR